MLNSSFQCGPAVTGVACAWLNKEPYLHFACDYVCPYGWIIITLLFALFSVQKELKNMFETYAKHSMDEKNIELQAGNSM